MKSFKLEQFVFSPLLNILFQSALLIQFTCRHWTKKPSCVDCQTWMRRQRILSHFLVLLFVCFVQVSTEDSEIFLLFCVDSFLTLVSTQPLAVLLFDWQAKVVTSLDYHINLITVDQIITNCSIHYSTGTQYFSTCCGRHFTSVCTTWWTQYWLVHVEVWQ